MKRWLPRGLSARIILLTLVALLVSQLVGYLSFVYNQDHLVQRVLTNYLSQTVPSINRMLRHVKPGEERAAVRGLSNPFASYAIRNRPLHCPPPSAPRPAYAKDLADKLGLAPDAARVCVGAGLLAAHPKRPAIAFSVRREDGRWLEIRASRPGLGHGWGGQTLRNILITLAIMIVMVVVASRRFTRPLRDLATAAERFGRGEAIDPVPERGGDEIKRSIIEFNRMHERIDRFVAERTRLVAALAHDLRTPITALRLRLEFLPNDDNTRAMRATLEDMAHMSEAALTFMREEASAEASRRMDLTALVDAVVEDYRAADAPVVFKTGDQVTLVCRPVAIRRALRNVIDNALAYGQSAEVSLVESPGQVVIEVADRGPGIAESAMSSVFDAFVRLETSRSRDTGGVGLGLSIARSVIRGHGGDITLGNRAEGGLVVRMTLPRARA
ncbi:ATP-binding protein [Salinisphaera hydrothermalis]|uniref:histidine kinase n=1 Tax=Salinisphaera hydrothermalis (strain C41B8) TaxID=1304275 RepID=A0A084IN08_SALHC|nr:ATP-binding protein [Salinisphaera hydrothermalis]KEZ78092.1 Signal transduction histidine kinase [Salinisphaera hydrothermalis C41B8]